MEGGAAFGSYYALLGELLRLFFGKTNSKK
jgi:hypothetical protein